MRIVLHAGLHKSGSTSLQASWHAAFSEPGRVWYPTRPEGALPGHHAAVWPLLDAFREVQPADLVWARALRGDIRAEVSGGVHLSDYVRRAADLGVETLLVSSEELDRLQASDVPRFREALGDHELTFVMTVTRPVHRWSSGWQTMVKHGLGQYPRDAARHIVSYGCLGLGRVEELMGLLEAQHRVVRVVRTSPPEETMPREVVEALGIEWPQGAVPPVIRNVSLGRDIEVLVRTNRADVSLGTKEKGDRKRLRAFVESATGDREVPGLAERYEPPAELWAAAEDEHDFLTRRAAAAGVEVIDPHDQLAAWTDRTPSEWYRLVSERELVVPGLPEPVELEELLWRVRQERSGLRVRLQGAVDRAERDLVALRRENGSQSAEIDRLRARLADMEASTSWRVTTPLRRAGRVAGRIRNRD